MWKEITYNLKSEVPLLMKNGRSANPLDKFAKALKQISGKRLKTDADYEEISRIEFMASLYMDEDGPILPSENLMATLINASKKRRQGKQAQAGMFITKHASLKYEGPRDSDSLFENEEFKHIALVRVQTARIARTRPIFKEWSCEVTVAYEDELVSEGDVNEWMRIAGDQIGICDWRPRFGRFTAIPA